MGDTGVCCGGRGLIETGYSVQLFQAISWKASDSFLRFVLLPVYHDYSFLDSDLIPSCVYTVGGQIVLTTRYMKPGSPNTKPAEWLTFSEAWYLLRTTTSVSSWCHVARDRCTERRGNDCMLDRLNGLQMISIRRITWVTMSFESRGR